LSVPFMAKSKLSFSEIIEAYENDEREALRKKAPLHRVFLNAVIKHLPDPVVSQKYRIPRLWRGDLESKTGKSLLKSDPNGPVAFVVTKVVADKYGEVAAGRLFCGTVKEGDDIFVAGTSETGRVQQVSIYNGAKRDLVKKAPAGNIVGLVGLNVRPGDTVTTKKDLQPFEQIKHIFEPVITKAIEAKKPSDLPKLIEVLRVVGKEDPSVEVEINEDTGEHLISGMGELHLEVIEIRIKSEKGIEVQTSPPIVVYRESVEGESPEVMGKSPNKHNKFFITVEKIPNDVYENMKKNDLPQGRVKKKDMRVIEALENVGLSKDDARDVRDIYENNLFLDNTKGIVYMNEIIDMVLDMFEEVMDHGPQAREPGIKMLVRFHDVKLHEDAIHRGPAQVYPAVRGAIRTAIMNADPIMFEPLQIYQLEAPLEFMGELSSLVSSKRGQMLNVDQDEYSVEIKAKIPVAETFGLSSNLRSATGGKGVMSLVDQLYEPLPKSLNDDVIRSIRDRKGLKDESEEE
ncbi:MAG: EF-Tu/IF-2/RF-3 family GTPase, partial [Candidatus Woesearchaeota archaeon]